MLELVKVLALLCQLIRLKTNSISCVFFALVPGARLGGSGLRGDGAVFLF